VPERGVIQPEDQKQSFARAEWMHCGAPTAGKSQTFVYGVIFCRNTLQIRNRKNAQNRINIYYNYR